MRASSVALGGAIIVAAAAGSPAVMSAASASPIPGQDIGWIWNSDDSDCRGKFVAAGEHFKLRKVGQGHMKLNYEYGTVEGDHHHEGARHTTKDWNHSINEGVYVEIQVCQVKSAWPDDCSGWRSGRA